MMSNKIKTLIIKCMKTKVNKKDYVRLLRKNKRFRVIRNNKYYKKGFSLQFQSPGKSDLMIPKQCGNYHIQIHVDKNFQLVKFMKIITKKRYSFIQQTNRYTRQEKLYRCKYK